MADRDARARLLIDARDTASVPWCPPRDDVNGPGNAKRRATRPLKRVVSAAVFYGLAKLTVTVMTTGTGLPFCVDGVYSHCCTASSAA